MEEKLKAHQENGLPPKYVDAVYDVDLFVEMAKAILLKHRIHFEGAEVCSIAHLIAIQYQTRGKDNA